MLTDRQYTILAAISEGFSISEAATRLGVTASALSQQIAKLNTKTGFSSIDKSQGHIALSPEGECLLRLEQTLRAQGEAGILALKRMANNNDRALKRISLATHYSIANELLVNFVMKTCPAYQIIIKHLSNSGDIQEELSRGEVDLVVGITPALFQSNLYTRIPLGVERFRYYTPGEREEHLPIEETRLISYENEECHGLALMEQALRKASGQRAEVAVRVPHYSIAIRLVSRMPGHSAFLPTYSEPGAFGLRPLRTSPVVVREISLFYRNEALRQSSEFLKIVSFAAHTVRNQLRDTLAKEPQRPGNTKTNQERVFQYRV
ncbi:MAG: LysR family transcriptional regulator [Segniliparus sp.]|uniref:LysR family transcriptional regulator n=1 Tax=Segniliparus sp. TaxID=2804064 RepID=UPI003F313ADC